MNADIAHQAAQLVLQFVTVSLVIVKIPSLQLVLLLIRRLLLNPSPFVRIQRLQDLIQLRFAWPLRSSRFVGMHHTEEQQSDNSFALHLRRLALQPDPQRSRHRIQDLILNRCRRPIVGIRCSRDAATQDIYALIRSHRAVDFDLLLFRQISNQGFHDRCQLLCQ